MKIFVLDACALIAYLLEENGYLKVKELFKNADKGEAKILMHAASLSEVYYDFRKSSSEERANSMLSDIELLPIGLISLISTEIIKEIGYFKTNYKISFADSFVLATAKLNNARIVTSDHHEFDPIEQNGDATFEWIR